MPVYAPLIPMIEQKILEEALYLNRPVYIEGDIGTGKSMLARWLAERKKSAKAITQIYLECKDLDSKYLEDRLVDKINHQHEMIVILDGVELIPLNLQSSVLQLIEKHQLRPISTAHLSLTKKVIKGEFRADLYSRLKGQSIYLRPLNECRKELPHILGQIAFLRMHAHLDKNAIQLLCRHPWPGNLTEVVNYFDNLRRHPMFSKTSDWEIFLKQNLPVAVPTKNHVAQIDETTLLHINQQGLRKFIKNFEKILVQKMYEKNQGHVRKTLHDLKISSGTFYRVIGAL